MTPKEKSKDRYLYRTYGITILDFYALTQVYDGRCWRCKRPPKPRKTLCVDHQHVKNYKKLPPEQKKKYVRGLLDWFCNKYRIGGITDPKEFDVSAEYLRNTKAQEVLK